MGLFEFDYSFFTEGHTSIAGIDEAGRGPWAGPVVARQPWFCQWESA